MNKKIQISAEVVAHSINPQGDELFSVLATFPRIIIAEMNTHRMLSKNTSSSRAIPFNKMVESVQNNPFIPIAWQKEHKGMQGTEYLVDRKHENAVYEWLKARDFAVKQASIMNNDGVTKQLCNRLLEPFMWTTMLITGPKSGWDNFFNLRCPAYTYSEEQVFKSKKQYIQQSKNDGFYGDIETFNTVEWLQVNKGQAEIHMMALAESIWDSVNESTPKQLEPGEWHIPFGDKMDIPSEEYINLTGKVILKSEDLTKIKVKSSVAMAARTSYTIVGEEKGLNYENLISLHDRLLTQDPPHSSPMEHCARAMSEDEYGSFYKGSGYDSPFGKGNGWCYNLKGFIPYRYFVDNGLVI